MDKNIKISKREKEAIINFIDDLLFHAPYPESHAVTIPLTGFQSFQIHQNTDNVFNDVLLLITSVKRLLKGVITFWEFINNDESKNGSFFIINFNRSKLGELRAILENSFDQRPDKVVFFKNEQLFLFGQQANFNATTLEFMLIRAMYQLAAAGGQAPYDKVINLMHKFGAKKRIKTNGLTKKHIQNTVARIAEDYKLEDGGSIFEIVPSFGVQLNNPKLTIK